MWRWCRKDLNGVFLEYARVGHRICTSAEALNRFVNALAAADKPIAPGAETILRDRPHPTTRPCMSEAEAARILDEAGI